MKRVLFVLLLVGLATPVWAKNRDSDEVFSHQLREAVEETYAEEGGKRDRDTISAEILVDASLNKVIALCRQGLESEDFAGVHEAVASALGIFAEAEESYPEVRIDLVKLSVLFMLDASAYGQEGDVPPAIESLEKVLGLDALAAEEAALVHFSVGQFYILNSADTSRERTQRSDDYRAGMQHIKKAIAMDGKYEKEFASYLDDLKRSKLIPLKGYDHSI